LTGQNNPGGGCLAVWGERRLGKVLIGGWKFIKIFKRRHRN